MTVPFGYDCLSRNNWNLEAAIANFEAVKVRVLYPGFHSAVSLKLRDRREH